MKLRNKKTGEILGDLGSFIIQNPNRLNCEAITKYDSLAELNEDWEDAPEEPKEYWFIAGRGAVEHARDTGDENDPFDKGHKEMGNYFETREEAELAVEKLRAWKRLKDKGFRFNKWTIPDEPKSPHIKLVIEAEMDVPDSPYDLDLLFSGGEE